MKLSKKAIVNVVIFFFLALYFSYVLGFRAAVESARYTGSLTEENNSTAYTISYEMFGHEFTDAYNAGE